MEYPNSITLVFKTSNLNNGLGTIDELGWRHLRQKELNQLLVNEDLGVCDGGGMGYGTMDIEFYVTNIHRAVEVIKKYLTDNEWIGFCKIASHEESTDRFEFHYPEGATSWDDDQ